VERSVESVVEDVKAGDELGAATLLSPEESAPSLWLHLSRHEGPLALRRVHAPGR